MTAPKSANSIHELSQLAISLHQVGENKYGCDVAKIALDLTQQAEEPLVLSAGGISIGDAIRLRKHVEKGRHTLAKGTKGFVVGFSPDGGYLCLLFPIMAPDGMLSLHKEKELQFLHKPRAADPHLFARGVGKATKKMVAAYDVRKNTETLKKELTTLLNIAGIHPGKLKRTSFSYGKFSALFESEGIYVRVMYRPYPHLVYEVGFPGSGGDVVSRKRSDAAEAIQRYFEEEDVG